MFTLWQMSLFGGLLSPSSVARGDATVLADTWPALVMLTLFSFASMQLWQQADARKAPFRQKIIFTVVIAFAASLGCSLLLHLPPELAVLTQSLILCGALTVVCNLSRLAGIESLRRLLLREVADKTADLERKNLELKRTQTALRTANIELKALSFTDSLTGAYNRLYFDRQFLGEWQRARREQEPLSMILVDIDHFKELNDRHGHPAGDDALKFVTTLLKTGFQRGNDIVCRYGGEEFVVLLPNTPPQKAHQRAEKVRKSIEQNPFTRGEVSLNITASFGVGGLVPQVQHEPLDLLHATDQALYSVKRNGRNGCQLTSSLIPAASRQVDSGPVDA